MYEEYYRSGKSYYGKKEYSRAIENFLLASRYLPDGRQLHTDLELSYFYSNNLKESKEWAKYLVELEEARPYAYVRLTNNYMGLGEYDSCIKSTEPFLNKLNKADKDNYAFVYLNLAVCYKRLGDVPTAIELTRFSLGFYEDATSHYNLGVYLADQGRELDAIAEYERAIELRPDYAKAIKNLNNIKARINEL